MTFTQNVTNNHTTATSKNRLSDRDMLFDLLLTEKQTSHMYEHAITESFNSDVTNTFRKLQQEEHENILALSEIMQEHGWTTGDVTGKSGVRRANRLSRSTMSNSSYAVTSGSQQLGNALDPDVNANNRERRFNNNPTRGNRNTLT